MVHDLLTGLNHHAINYVPRSENSLADALAVASSSVEPELGRELFHEIVVQPSIEVEPAKCIAVEYTQCWFDPILKYLTTSDLLESKTDAEPVRRKSLRFAVVDAQ